MKRWLPLLALALASAGAGCGMVGDEYDYEITSVTDSKGDTVELLHAVGGPYGGEDFSNLLVRKVHRSEVVWFKRFRGGVPGEGYPLGSGEVWGGGLVIGPADQITLSGQVRGGVRLGNVDVGRRDGSGDTGFLVTLDTHGEVLSVRPVERDANNLPTSATLRGPWQDAAHNLYALHSGFFRLERDATGMVTDSFPQTKVVSYTPAGELRFTTLIDGAADFEFRDVQVSPTGELRITIAANDPIQVEGRPVGAATSEAVTIVLGPDGRLLSSTP